MRFNSSKLRSALLAAMMAGGACGLNAQAAPPPKSTLSLGQAIQYGLANSPQLQQAEAGVKLASASVVGAKAARLPRIDAAEEVTLSNDPVFAFGTRLRQGRFTNSDFDLRALNEPSPISNFASSANATWTIFDFGATSHNIRAAQNTVQAANLSRQFSESGTANAITSLFYRVLLSEGQVTVAEGAVARAQEIDTDIGDRVHAGLALEADGMRAGVLLRSAQDDLAAAHSNVRVARVDLFDAIGLPFSSIALVPPAPEASIPSGVTSQLERRPDIEALDRKQAGIRQNLDSIHSSAFPQLGAYGHVEADNPHLFSGGGSNWAIGARLELHVFDGGARRARAQEAEAELLRLSAQKERVLRDTLSHIASLQAQIEDLRRRYETSDQTILADRVALQAARDRYAAGLISVSDVLNEEVGLSVAEYDRTRAHYQICILTSDLQLANNTFVTAKAGRP